MLLRVAVTGRKETPPLFDTMQVLGRDTTLARMDAAARRSASSPQRTNCDTKRRPACSMHAGVSFRARWVMVVASSLPQAATGPASVGCGRGTSAAFQIGHGPAQGGDRRGAVAASPRPRCGSMCVATSASGISSWRL